MKKTTLLFLALATHSIGLFAQAKINNGSNVWHTDAALPDNYLTVNEYYSMNSFVENEKYKIVIEKGTPELANNVQMALNNSTIISDMEFTFTNPNNATKPFSLSYFIPRGTSIGQSQEIKFKIFRKRLGIWDWQTTFFFYSATTCAFNYTTTGNTMYSGDYEVAGNLNVTGVAYPNGGNVELDGGESVTLLPSFATNLNQGGVINVIIDGCGGAYKLANATNVSSQSDNLSVEKNETIHVFPNPAKDELFIALPEELTNQNLSVQVMDINGKIVLSDRSFSTDRKSIDLSSLDQGMYFIQLLCNNLNYTHKFIKN